MQTTDRPDRWLSRAEFGKLAPFPEDRLLRSEVQAVRFLARRYDNSSPVIVEIAAGRIQRIRPTRTTTAPDSLPWVGPGLVDVQHNGYGGREFNEPDLSIETVAEISRAQDACGLVAYCPTATTHSDATLAHSMRTIAAACDHWPDVARRIAGIHLEGPYISPEDGPRGAHPREHVRPPDWDEFQKYQDAAGGRIRILTMSPEYDGSAEFISRVAAMGVRVAIGHTNANSEQIRAAVDAGAVFSTHLGNGAHPRIRRHPNYIWDQLADDRLWASLIVDGHHLPPAVVKSFVRAKTPERCLLVSDITGMAGLPPGRYDRTSLGSVEVLEDGKLVVAGQRDLLAGAALPIGVGIAKVMQFAGVDLKTAVDMASVQPALLIGRAPGRLEEQAPADLTLFDLRPDPRVPGGSQFVVRATIQAGEVVYGEVVSP